MKCKKIVKKAEEFKLKRLKVILMVAASALLLVACGSSNNKSAGTTSNKNTQLTGQAGGKNYQGVIKDGHYQTSKSRGVDIQQNDNQFNLKGFQNGLLGISKQNFSTNKYVFQEGQYISTDTTEKWLDRKSKQNPEGLNPSQQKGKVTPMYLQQIDEQDFLVPDGNKTTMKGMTIGLGINSVYYYTKQKYGSQYQQKIPDDVVEKQGKEMANTILKRLRQNKELKNIPIVIALYKQAPNDSLTGGNFFASSVNNSGTTSVNSWKPINEKSYVFPIADGSKGPNTNDLSAFNQFKSQIQNFFPNLSGITAQAQYKGKQLQGMHINITTQFYSQTEIISFTQYLQNAAQKYLPANVPIDITVKSTDGIQSFLNRNSGGKTFSSHVFNSY
ncbi:CamS family sex pheromone protein [Fructilactobacillus fructivorans]|uniref:CamS family sex pheromone protein n=1 Tax=Fructilactobacillus fructivorans TaxID=1614 RepID=UPI00057C9F1C|nr:CamS family sex pheromone protein [Fructilactobacillus fructivorans]MCT0151757.1 CamS family sex pheromone protein [Fructilactobacillus fructivorans]MCT2867115.1 CamS family sex pheromone protein [Fructilactobacillus fructivorans]MCT2868325.1 CamS family sex pheromone protein [Fructilactobacillus fructivorans]MCT2873033.1 CamS family sex pheromone protein [Fructilactobacillus fructivorans]